MAEWVEICVARNKARGLGAVHSHVTRMFPRRRDDLLDGGSIYWVIKGHVLVRQTLIDMMPVTGEDGIERCARLMAPPLIPTEAQPKRAFLGWRYLRPEDAPTDLDRGGSVGSATLRAELAELGLL